MHSSHLPLNVLFLGGNRYNFDQNQNTGVVSRVFDTSDPVPDQFKYFALVNKANGNALKINGDSCDESSAIEIQRYDRKYERNYDWTNDYAIFSLTSDGQLESKGCPGMVLTNIDKVCSGGNKLGIEALAGSDDKKRWIFYNKDDIIVNRKCKASLHP